MASKSSQMTSLPSSKHIYKSVSHDESDEKAEHTIDIESNLIGQQITLKKIAGDVSGTITYQIESLKSQTKPLPDLINASTNQWLFLATCQCKKCDDNQLHTQRTDFSIAIIVIILQIVSYFTLTWYLIASVEANAEERSASCYGPHCKTKQQHCIHISAGGVTALLLVGFLYADFINVFVVIKESICQTSSCCDRSRLLGSLIILLELGQK